MNTYLLRVLHPPREVLAHTRAVAERFAERGITDVRCYQFDGCRVVVAHEPIDGEMTWHLSVQGPGRLPDWQEILHARDSLLPTVTMGLYLPPRIAWSDAHPYQVHLWELPAATLAW